MAEFGAHLVTAASELPSIFEVLAQESLTSTLRPAFAHLIKVIVQLDPGRLSVFWRWHDEIFSVLDLCLQHYCLKAFGASFAENFYGLKRLPIDKRDGVHSPGYKLPLSNHRRALFCLAIAPYLKSKLDNIYERFKEENTEERPNRQFECMEQYQKVVVLLAKLYPLVHLSWEMAILICQMKYALGRTTFPSPSYWLARTQLVTLTDEDDTNRALWRFLKDLQDARWSSFPSVIISHLKTNGRELLTTAFSLGTFFLQFLEWWYVNRPLPSEDSRGTIIPPPEKNAKPPLLLGNICPLCCKTRTNDAVLPVSGYVFCYPCIYHHIKQTGKCPITQLPASLSSLVRLYIGNSTS